MSNVLSIAAVTAVIKDLLENGLVSDAIVSSIGDVMVTALPPDRISVEADERPQLNLFLYQISPNRNADWLSNTADKQFARDARATNPPLALDLYYLLTAYGAKDFQAELLLGYAIHLLYKIPVLTSDRIETALNNATKVSAANVFSQALSAISAAELAQNLGEIKISSEFFNLEETSRLWSVLQTNYRPSTAYKVSMVSIPDRHDADPAVKNCLLPQIDLVTSIGDRSITINNSLLIRGRDLRGEITKIRIGKQDILLTPQDVTPNQITLKVPAHLVAGVQGIQILHALRSAPDRLIESNLAAFVLHPEITATVTQIRDRDRDVRSADIAVKFIPKVGASQQVILLLTDPAQPHKIVHTCPAIPAHEDTDLLTFTVANLAAGNYLVRVRVDGAESQLHVDLFGKYGGTQVVIP